jgi:dephospho-CoA kinase
MLVLGLTGSLASGKSTVTAMFAGEGAATFDADAAVHALYRGSAAPLIAAAFPGVVSDGVVDAGVVDRARLSASVGGDPAALARLEAIVHPLVRAAEVDFLARAAAAGRRIAVLDIPLLFEAGREAGVDAVVVVSAPLEVRRERALRRPGVTEARFAALSARQLPDADKRARAHFIIDTQGPLSATQKQVRDVVRAVTALAAGKARQGS